MASWRRRVVIGVGSLAALAAAVLGLVHLPAVQRRVVAWAFERVEAAAGVVITAESASFNLFTFEASADHVAAAAVDSRQTPFLIADRVVVQLPFAAATGPLRIDRIGVSHPVLTVVRRADGSLNLPTGNGEASEGALPHIGVIDVSDAEASYRDEVADASADASRIQVRLSGGDDGSLSGPVMVGRLSMSGGGLAIEDATLYAEARYAEGTVVLDRTAFATPFERGRLNASGRLATSPLVVDAHLEWTDIRTEALTRSHSPVAIGAIASGQADVDWPVDEGLAALNLTLQNESRAAQEGEDAVGLAGSLSFQLTGGDWHVRQEHQIAGVVEIAGDMGGRLAAEDPMQSTIGGAVDVAAPDLPRAIAAMEALNLEWPPDARPSSGRLRARLNLDGRLAAPFVNGTATLDEVGLAGVAPLAASTTFSARGDESQNVAFGGSLDLDVPELAGQPIGRIRSRVAYESGRLRVADVLIEPPEGGRLTGELTLTPASGAFSASFRAENVHVRPIRLGDESWPLLAIADGQFTGRGTLDRPMGSGTLAFSELVWDGTSIAPLDVDVQLAGDEARVQARAPALSATLDGHAALAPPRAFEATATADGTDLRGVLSRLDRDWPPIVDDLAGSFAASVTASGALDRLNEAAVAAELRRLDVALGDARLALDHPSAVRLEDGRIAVDGLLLRSGATSIQVDGALGAAASGQITLTVDGQLDDARPWMALAGVPDDLAISGRVHGSLSASGALERPELVGRVELRDGRAGWADYPEATDIAADATVAGGTIDVGSIAARWEGARASGRLEVPLSMLSDRLAAPPEPDSSTSRGPAVASVTARVEDLTEQALASFLEPDAERSLTGRVSADVELRADALSLERLRGTVLVDTLSIDADGVPVNQVRPTRVDIEGAAVRIVNLSLDAEGNRFDVSGTAQLSDPGSLDLRAAGRVDLRVIGAALPGVTTTGVADVMVTVTGTPALPLADGRADIRGAEIRMSDPQIAATGVQAHVELSGERVQLVSADGSLNGGRFTATGDFAHHDFVPTGGSLRLNGSDVALNVPEGLRTQIAPALTLAFANERARLSGTVAIQRGAYREPLSLAMSLVDTARQQAAATLPAVGQPFSERLDLDVSLESREDLVIDNNYGRMRMSVDLRLVGTAAQPSVVGRATIREGGALYLGGRVYQIERGTIDFSDPRAIVPDLDLLARTRISGVDISLSITGTPDTVAATLTSDPPYAQGDIVSLLVTGRLADEAGGAGPEVASSQVLAYLSGEAFGFAAQAIGVDTLRLERGTGVSALRTDPLLIASDADPTTRLTVSKRFSTYAEVILSRNLSDGGQFSWIASVTPGYNLETRVVSLDDSTRLYELRHDISFGGATASAAPRVVRAGRVSAIVFTGDLGVPESELRMLLSLDAGDPFDFYRWQEDRERIRRFYLDRGYLEAAVEARHGDQTDDGLDTLEYEIDPGPRTVLDIEGYEPSGATRARLREVWSNAIFDEALVADLREALVRELAADGYLRPAIDVSRPTIPPGAPGEKHVRIAVEPGPRTTSRVVQFIGNTHVPAARLDQLVTPGSWLRPGDLAAQIEALYRREGYLAAAASSGPIVFDGDRAVLSASVNEGPLFTVSSVTFSGESARSEAEVRAAFGVAPPMPYTDDAVERARRALDADYAAHGFNAATVTTETTVDREHGTAAVAVTIDEGRQQVLERVDVTGTDGLDPGALRDVLKLEPGTPANLATWYGARRRVLDLGMFRSVDIEPILIEDADAVPGVEKVEARVSVVRQPRWRLRYGFDVTDEPVPAADERKFGAGASADLQRRGLFSRAATLGISGRVDNNDRIGRTFLSFPTFFGRNVKSSVFLSRSRQALGEGEFLSIITNKTTATAEQRFTPWRSLQLAYGYQFEWNHTSFLDATDPHGIPIELVNQQARLTSTAIVDTRPDPSDARSGLFHSSNVEYGAAALGSDVRFLKYVLQQFVYAPLGPMVSASGLRLGAGVGFGQELLPSERFFVGGVNTVRGYANNALGEVDFFGDPIGGQAMVVLNQELRFPIFRWVRGVGFIDAGNVFERATDLSFTDLAVGAGGGLRLATPVGLLRVDVGVPLPRQDRSPRFYFSFGQIF